MSVKGSLGIYMERNDVGASRWLRSVWASRDHERSEWSPEPQHDNRQTPRDASQQPVGLEGFDDARRVARPNAELRRGERLRRALLLRLRDASHRHPDPRDPTASATRRWNERACTLMPTCHGDNYDR